MARTRNLRVAIGIALLAGGSIAFGAVESTAYINMEKVFEGFYKTRRAESSLRKQEAVYKERADTAVKELEELKEKFERLRKESESVALSDEAKERKQEEARGVEIQLRDKERDLQKYFADKKREMQGDYMKSRNMIVKEILQFVRTYADENGYDVVMDVSGMTQNMLPVILKYPEDKEITPIILQELNRGHEEEAAGGEPEPEEDEPPVEGTEE